MKYKDLFENLEESLKSNLYISKQEFEVKADYFKNLDFRILNDDQIFWISTSVVFYSGIKSVIIENKLDLIKEHLYGVDKIINYSQKELSNIIQKLGFARKINYVIKNAHTFKNIQNKYGSFRRYLEQRFDILTIDVIESKIEILKSELQCGKFKFMNFGPRTTYHFLTDLGFKVLKPDRVICRIFERLGLIKNRNEIGQAQEVGNEIAKQTNYPIRYIDIVFVKYGQLGKSNVLGTKGGICLEVNPHCELCRVQEDCKYYNNVVSA